MQVKYQPEQLREIDCDISLWLGVSFLRIAEGVLVFAYTKS